MRCTPGSCRRDTRQGWQRRRSPRPSARRAGLPVRPPLVWSSRAFRPGVWLADSWPAGSTPGWSGSCFPGWKGWTKEARVLRPLMRLHRLLPLAALLVVPGCGLFSNNGDFGEPDYASEASTNLKRGDEALESSQYQLAEKYFEYVKTKFPFLEASRQAELRLADVSFERELWSEAADRYNGFVKLHPTHAKVDYAAYRAALSHYRDIPGDWFLLPPSSEKDQTQVRAAWEALNEFTKTY